MNSTTSSEQPADQDGITTVDQSQTSEPRPRGLFDLPHEILLLILDLYINQFDSEIELLISDHYFSAHPAIWPMIQPSRRMLEDAERRFWRDVWSQHHLHLTCHYMHEYVTTGLAKRAESVWDQNLQEKLSSEQLVPRLIRARKERGVQSCRGAKGEYERFLKRAKTGLRASLRQDVRLRGGSGDGSRAEDDHFSWEKEWQRGVLMADWFHD